MDKRKKWKIGQPRFTVPEQSGMTREERERLLLPGARWYGKVPLLNPLEKLRLEGIIAEEEATYPNVFGTTPPALDDRFYRPMWAKP